MISKALKIAYTAHQNQIDKGGIPYVQHPIRVALHIPEQGRPVIPA